MDLEREQIAVSGGYELSVAHGGPTDGPAVVFLHGSGPGASAESNFKQNIDAFADAGYRVILPDLIGYGGSSMPEGIDYTLQLFTDTVYEALQKLGIKKAALVGNSLGGGIALQMELDHPGYATAMVLMAPGCIEEQASYFTMPGIKKMVSGFGGPDFNVEEQRRLVSNLVYDASIISDTLVKERFAVASKQPKDVLARMKTPNLGPELGKVKCPIFVLWGLNDEFCPESGARHFLDKCEDARCLTFNTVGHWVQVERAAEFNRYAVDFLNDQR
ncbi:alpha/beta hydrolase [Croceicoccus sp. F390]|uniref:Alpha/beta hydrolase n=1 Tax=Croceicoccus esteveae TaxID=3075597 RepID=A0ABU2ZGK2_9SPHN|nr:alpha/beta hydrolase [Croceicoccus sp. F390]MDT0575346.1 alpha/beta hydrolase [Croceicoccus sp. F390]